MAQRCHIALSIPEIVRLVCSFLIPPAGVYYTYRQNAALNLALVSRIFFHAAIPYRWEDINIKDLFRLLPCAKSYLWGRCSRSSGGVAQIEGEALSSQEPTNEQLSRIKFYGCYVQKMTIGARPRIHERSLEELFETPIGHMILQYVSEHTLLPNLREIEVLRNHAGAIPLNLTISLTPPELRRLTVGINSLQVDPSQRGLNLTETVLEKCPELDTLNIFTVEGTISLDQPWFVTRFPLALSLRRLWVHSELVTHDFLDWASMLPSLQQLNFYAATHDWDALDKNFRPPCPRVFSTVKDLNLVLDTVLDPVVVLWETCEYPLLENLAIHYRRLSFNDPRMHLFAARVARQNPQIKILRAFSTLNEVHEEDLSNWLGKLRSLKVSRLHLHTYLTNHEEKIENLTRSIASYWAGLQDLIWDNQTLTIDRLSLVASLFPKLRFFEFDYMALPGSLTNVANLPSTSGPPLTLRFDFRHASPSKLDILARCLANLRCVTECQNTDTGRDIKIERWLNAKIQEYSQ